MEPPSHWPPRLTELYMFGRFAPGCLQEISSHPQTFLRVIKLTGSRLRESDVLDMTNEAGCRLQTLEISASAAEICRRNFDCLLHHLPVIHLNIHICTGCVDAKFFGPFKIADESISALRELALDCPKGYPPPRRVNWIDGGKVVSIDSIWSRLSKLAMRREKNTFSQKDFGITADACATLGSFILVNPSHRFSPLSPPHLIQDLNLRGLIRRFGNFSWSARVRI